MFLSITDLKIVFQILRNLAGKTENRKNYDMFVMTSFDASRKSPLG
jgi:hypothetical protein